MKKNKIIRVVLIVLAAGAALWLGAVFLLPVVLPFLIGLLIARLAQPVVRFLQERVKLPRWLASGLAVLGLFCLLGAGVYWLCRSVCGELARFTQELPVLLQSLAQPMARLRSWATGLTERAPEFLAETLRESLDSFFENGSVVAEKGYAALFSLASSTIAGLPDLFLFLVTTVLASFMICSQYEAIWAFADRQLPAAWKNRYESVVTSLRTTLVAWLKAQMKLIGVNFLLLTMGLMLLNVEFPLLFGALIALIDALPVFGTGTVLIPWGILSFLRGNTRMGVGLMLLYGAAYLTRTTLEPRLVGRQMGLNPLLTLLALYAGYRIMGVAGMIVFPIGAILIKQFWDHTVPKTRFESPGGGNA